MTIRARYDGRVIVPEQPVNLPVGQELIVHLEPASVEGTASATAIRLRRSGLAQIWSQMADGESSSALADRLRQEAESRRSGHGAG
jgi:hypothetical protein